MVLDEQDAAAGDPVIDHGGVGVTALDQALQDGREKFGWARFGRAMPSFSRPGAIRTISTITALDTLRSFFWRAHGPGRIREALLSITIRQGLVADADRHRALQLGHLSGALPKPEG